ncbi:MAG: hypothetical protein ACQERF_08460 [Actinomycetota bacterium]
MPDETWIVGQDVAPCENPFEVTGGAGRFEDATGEGHLSGRILFMGFESLDSWAATWEFTGRSSTGALVRHGSSRLSPGPAGRCLMEGRESEEW